MKRDYTEEEILEMGRKALAKAKIKVYVVHYVHKHGDSISVYGGRQSAENAATELMKERVGTSWCDEDIAKFQLAWNYNDQSELFHEIEKNVSYGETIKVLECVVGA